MSGDSIPLAFCANTQTQHSTDFEAFSAMLSQRPKNFFVLVYLLFFINMISRQALMAVFLSSAVSLMLFTCVSDDLIKNSLPPSMQIELWAFLSVYKYV